jgi:hypothetical protein
MAINGTTVLDMEARHADAKNFTLVLEKAIG